MLAVSRSRNLRSESKPERAAQVKADFSDVAGYQLGVKLANRYQYSSGKSKVVTDRSHSVIM